MEGTQQKTCNHFFIKTPLQGTFCQKPCYENTEKCKYHNFIAGIFSNKEYELFTKNYAKKTPKNANITTSQMVPKRVAL